jgi:hypothetical protein
VTIDITLLSNAQFGWAACAFAIAAFVLWWSDQPGAYADQDLFSCDAQRARARYPKGK